MNRSIYANINKIPDIFVKRFNILARKNIYFLIKFGNYDIRLVLEILL